MQNYQLKDIVQMKKPHACGANEWQINRLGADIKLTCQNCGRSIMLSRRDFEHRLKKIIRTN